MTTERVVIESVTPQEDPAHVAAMIAKVDAAEAKARGETPAEPAAKEEPKADRPEWLPEGFNTPEEFAAEYAKLKGEKPAEAAKVEPAAAPEGDQSKAAEEVLASKGLNMADFSNEWETTGQLSEDSFAKLEKAGIDRTTVNAFIAGQQALADKFEGEVKEITEGRWDAMVAWAKDGLSDEDKVAYNKAVDSRDPGQVKLAVSGLYAKFSNARPSEPNLVSGSSKGGADVYESLEQMKADMRDPLYKKDPAFRDKVKAKLSRSNVL